MALEVAGRLEGEDLVRYRAVDVKRQALERNPGAYSAMETEQIVMAEVRMQAEISERFGLDPSRAWMCSPIDGVVFYGKEYDA